MRIPETEMNGRRARDVVERYVDRLNGVLARRFIARLHIRFIELDHVDSCGEQRFDFIIDSGGVCKRCIAWGTVVVDLSLLGHSERPGNGDLGPALGVGDQEFRIAHLDRAGAADGPGDPGHRVGVAGAIEIAPLAYMRGRTLNTAFVILDESQNTTNEQMFMFLTRLGFHSKAVITGDPTQIDLSPSKQSGLIEAIEILKKTDGIAINKFTQKDVVRHPLVQKIISAYEIQRSQA